MIERIATPSKTKEIIEQNAFYFKKNYGQNFLIDANVLQNMISAADISDQDFVLEIGPGIGSLTQFLAENAKNVVAVEIDDHLIPILKETVGGYDNLTIIHSDVLKLDLGKLIAEKNHGNPIKVAANLPYYITTPILMELLEKEYPITSITVMVQREVADRMQAAPGSKDYGALSVAVQFYSTPHPDFIVPPACFMPRPKVDSAVITLHIGQNHRPEVTDCAFFFRIVKSAFAQRRKTLVNTLSATAGLSCTKEEQLSVLETLHLSPTVRGETLSVEQFASLANALYPYR